MVTFSTKTYSKRLLHLVSWSHWFTFFNIIAAIGVSSFYIFNENMPETLFGQVYLMTTWVSHMSFLTFISFVLILFPLTILFPQTKFIRTSAAIIYTLGLVLLILDAFIYNKLGYHLNASSSDQIIQLIVAQVDKNPRLFWSITTVVTILILVFELVVSNYAWKHLAGLQKTIFARFVVFGLVIAFVFSHLTHIWADANLEYELLRQDTVLPLSYPSTAKTLLTKYGLFNINDYMERKTSALSFTDSVPQYPQMNEQQLKQCSVISHETNGSSVKSEQSVFMILTNEMLQSDQIKRFASRANGHAMRLTKHIDNAANNNAWFNLFYSLPTIYQPETLAQKTSPLLFQAINEKNLTTSFTEFGLDVENQSAPLTDIPGWVNQLFETKNSYADISNHILVDKLNSYPAGLHVFYFSDKESSQFELFVEALLIAQKQKAQADYLWVSSIGNTSDDTRLKLKPALMVFPDNANAIDIHSDGFMPINKLGKSRRLKVLSSHMDVQATILTHWLNCQLATEKYSNGSDLGRIKQDEKNRIIANTVDNGVMVFNKDKSILVDQNGNFQSYSQQLESPIMISPDFPLMIDGVNFIKQFSLQNQTLNDNKE
jgi:membrane-anchored protein YejM (alkaline phosphatase superfamily)